MPQSYKIPQKVDLEDKILGPLTLKQFFYALAAGLATFIEAQILQPFGTIPVIIAAVLTWCLAGAFIFVRPNEQPFSKFIYALYVFSTRPKQRRWQRLPLLGEVQLVDAVPVKKEVVAEPTVEEMKGRLQRLAHIVDTRGWAAADSAMGERVTGGDAQAHYNIFLSESDHVEDVLEAEDEGIGSDRASNDLDRVLKTVGAKPAPSQPHENRPASPMSSEALHG